MSDGTTFKDQIEKVAKKDFNLFVRNEGFGKGTTFDKGLPRLCRESFVSSPTTTIITSSSFATVNSHGHLLGRFERYEAIAKMIPGAEFPTKLLGKKVASVQFCGVE